VEIRSKKTNLIKRLAVQSDMDYLVLDTGDVGLLREQIETVFENFRVLSNDRHVIMFIDNFGRSKMEALEGFDWRNSKVRLILGIQDLLSQEIERQLERLFGGSWTAHLS